METVKAFNMKPALHVLSLPHTSTTAKFISCAYTMKARNFATMMTSIGYDVYLYGGPENDADCKEHIVIASKEEQQRWFGDYSLNDFYPITWAGSEPHWTESNNNAIREISARIQPKDIICIIGGTCQQQIANALPAHISVEYGIGYTGVFAKYKVFESYSHMHWIYGRQNNDNGQFFDCVIPNYFNPSEFNINQDEAIYSGENVRVVHNEEYYVFLGRLIERKGPEIAVEATRRLGKKLILAGQGLRKQTVSPNGDINIYGDGMKLSGPHIQHIGTVDVNQRLKLLAGAKATFMGTTYLEPFGGVSIESLMCGTPVIATDFGVFPENIPHGVVGYRFRTIEEAAHFASDEMLKKLDRPSIREYAISNFSMDRVRYMYDDYFTQLQLLWENGFYARHKVSNDRYTKFI